METSAQKLIFMFNAALAERHSRVLKECNTITNTQGVCVCVCSYLNPALHSWQMFGCYEFMEVYHSGNHRLVILRLLHMKTWKKNCTHSSDCANTLTGRTIRGLFWEGFSLNSMIHLPGHRCSTQKSPVILFRHLYMKCHKCNILHEFY